MTSTTKVSLLGLLLLLACSGAKETELFGPPAQGASGTTPIGGSTDEDAGAASSGEHAGSSDDGSDHGTSSGGSSSSSGGADKDAGAPPSPPSGPVCTAEVEPNNEADRATPFMSCVTGTLKKSDVDFVEIFAPANTSKVAITHEETGGKVSYRVYVNGLPFPSFTGDAPDYIPAVTSATYRFQIQPSGSGSTMRTYRLSVSFD